ncbi:MAG: response regulator [Methanospirillum sp.]
MDEEAGFLQRLRQTFRAEAFDHLSAIVRGLDELKDAGDEERRRVGETLLREAHSLKGAARAVNLGEVELRSQSLETAFSRIRAGLQVPSPQEMDRYYADVDELFTRISEVVPPAAGAVPPGPARAEIPTERPQRGDGETARVPATLLDELFREVRDLLPVVRSGREVENAVHDLLDTDLGTAPGATPPRPDVIRYRLQRLEQAAGAERRGIRNRVERLLALTYSALLTPASGLLDSMARIAREQARVSGKELDVVLGGGDLEIDRHLLDALVDPLVHLVTNAVVHGIEAPAERRRLGKPARGQLSIAVSLRSGRLVELRVDDDGAGIDTAAVRAAAVERGLIDAEAAAALPDATARRLVFYSGVSTSPLTMVAGRGVGLAAVRERIERLGGRLAVESACGRGTTFTMTLPMTLLTLRGLIVRIGSEHAVVPFYYLLEVLSRPAEAIVAVQGGSAVVFEERLVPIVHLADVLERPRAPPRDDRARIVLVETSPGTWGFAVDEVVGEETLYVQAFGRPLARVRNIAGATILPDGTPAPVLHAPDLVRSAIARTGTGAAPIGAPPAEEPPARVLVVEDSITARTLLRTILVGAGYVVETATDGLDAWNRLAVRPFDLVVTDLDMPVMDGFTLTRRIRQDPALSALPVVLVTALDSRADRERGMAAGANAFVVKSSFEQSDLLEVLRRLL